MVKKKPSKSTEIKPPPHADWGPELVNGMSYHRRITGGHFTAIPAQQTEGGMVTAHALKRPAECLLDVLLAGGRLGPGDQGKRRYEAGMWLRELYHERAMMSPRSTGHYGEGRGGSDEITDAVAWNRRCYHDTLRAVAGLGKVLADACCHDVLRAADVALCDALDRLADHRGM